MTAEQKLCPDCDEPRLSAADGVLQCTSCGWSEEDDDEIERLDLARLQAIHERDCAVEDVKRLLEREHQAAVILATALAGGGSPEQAHWMHDAAVWLNDRRAADVTTTQTENNDGT